MSTAPHPGGPQGPSDTTTQVSPSQEKQTLKFYFAPAAEPEAELARPNPHAKASTEVGPAIEALRGEFGEAVGEVVAYAGEMTVFVDRARIVDVCRFLKADLGFTYLSDLGTIDRFVEGDRFEVFYNVINMRARKRLRVKVRVPEDDPVVETVTGVFPAANWHEREVWDMMGIRFSGHPDLRRMLMPEDFEYFPARKDFPTLGIPGSLPLPPQATDGELTPDPYPRAHGRLPRD